MPLGPAASLSRSKLLPRTGKDRRVLRAASGRAVSRYRLTSLRLFGDEPGSLDAHLLGVAPPGAGDRPDHAIPSSAKVSRVWATSSECTTKTNRCSSMTSSAEAG